MSAIWTQKEIDDFAIFVENVRNGTITDPAYVLQPDEKSNNPTYEEIAANAQNLPTDDPQSWVKLSKCGNYLMNPLFLHNMEHLNIKF